MKILNYGSLNLDYVYSVPHFVRPGETLSARELRVNCGGKGLNQSVALARTGAEVWHVGAVGAKDGDTLLSAMEADHIHTHHIARLADSASGHAIIQVDATGQNCILIHGGANQRIAREQAEQAIRCFEPGDFLILQNEVNGNACIMELAHKKGMKVVLNPSPINDDALRLPLDLVDWFMLNEVEAAQLCGGEDRWLDRLHQRYPKAGIVLTLGKKGVACRLGDLHLTHGIYDVPVVDTTAAGDTFTGFFIGSLAQGIEPAEALRLASIASSIAVSRRGAQCSIPSMEEVRASRLALV